MQEVDRILNALGFELSGDTAGPRRTWVVPSWRIDVGVEEDLVEEIARHVGYDKIASELPPSNMSGEYQPRKLNLALFAGCLLPLAMTRPSILVSSMLRMMACSKL